MRSSAAAGTKEFNFGALVWPVGNMGIRIWALSVVRVKLGLAGARGRYYNPETGWSTGGERVNFL